MVDTDALVDDIMLTEDEVEAKHSAEIQKEIYDIIINKYGEESKKYLDLYFDDSIDNDDSDDPCPECSKSAKDMIDNINIISNNINIINSEVNNIIVQKLKDSVVLKLRIIDTVSNFIKNTMTQIGYDKIDNQLVQKLASVYLLHLSILEAKGDSDENNSVS